MNVFITFVILIFIALISYAVIYMNNKNKEEIKREEMKQIQQQREQEIKEEQERQQRIKLETEKRNIQLKEQEERKRQFYKILEPEYNKSSKEFLSDYIIPHIETTGLEWYECEIIEISAIKFKNNEEIDRFQQYIKPSKPITSEITKINNITNEMVKNAPDIKSVLEKFLIFLEDYDLVIHNPKFTMFFLQEQFDKHLNIELENEVVDFLPIAKKYIKNLGNHKLSSLKHYFDLPIDSPSAIYDCEAISKAYAFCFNQSKKADYELDTTFLNNENNLSEFENQVFSFVSKIISESQLEEKALRSCKKTKYTEILYIREVIFKFNPNVQKKYVLINMDINSFKKQFGNIEKCCEAPKSEGGTRFIFDKAEQLSLLKGFIIARYIEAQNLYNIRKDYY